MVHRADGAGSTARTPATDGTIGTYSWDFGDDSGSVTGVQPTHTVATTGSYVVTLTVTDDGGLTDSTTITVNVTAPPASTLTFVGETSAAGNATLWTATVPAAVQAGDTAADMVLGRERPRA